MHLKKSNKYIMESKVVNPTTGRKITLYKDVFNKLIKQGYTYDTENNILLIDASLIPGLQPPPIQQNNKHFGDSSIIDSDIPDINVKPLTPTYKTFKNKIIKNCTKIADWLWQLLKNKKKNANDIAEWIENMFVPDPKDEYLKINIPHSDEETIIKLIEADRQKYGKEYHSKYLKMYIYNNIKSLDDIHEALHSTYKKEDKSFKLLFSFGYVTEKFNEDEETWQARLYYASHNYFYDDSVAIENKNSMNEVIGKVTTEHIVRKLSAKFPDTKTRLIGIYSMAVKVTRLDYPIGAPVELPDYIRKSPHIICLADAEYNSCFWDCLALAYGCRRDRYKAKSKSLSKGFYNQDLPTTYQGFDMNHLDNYEEFDKNFAINVVIYNEDESIEYVRKSSLNDQRKPIYLNLYSNHFSYITDLKKLAKMYICNRCSSKHRNNGDLQRHIDTCKVEQKDKFVKYPQIYEKPRNIIAELCDWFEVELDFKYDYLITWDFESILLKINETTPGSNLKYYTKHVPICVSIATNVEGFKDVKFFLDQDPQTLCYLMFDYFDQVQAEAKRRMELKMVPLIRKISQHYNESDAKTWLQKVFDYCETVPIVGFNSGFYDINLVIEWFMKEILKRDANPFVIKNEMQYKVIKTSQFLFLDQMNYVGPGYNLRKFIKAYCTTGEEKSYFPYEWFDCYDKLDCLVSDLKIEDFKSTLKDEELSPDDFNNLMQTCKSLNLIYIRDLLKYYSCLDVGPFLNACLEQKKIYYDRELDMYKDAFTLPGLSEKILFQPPPGFREYLQRKIPENNHHFNPNNIDEKITGYKKQDDMNVNVKHSEFEFYISKEEILKLFEKQKYQCYYCWFKLYNKTWSLDRIDCSLPHTSGNCVIACINCNKHRSDTFMPIFYRRKALIRFAKDHPMIYLVGEKDKRVFYKLKQNIVGGPSIVYHRYHEKDKTKIDRLHYDKSQSRWYYNEGDGKVVKSIVGFDANALYLYCLGQDQLCGKLEWIPTEEEYKIEYDLDTASLDEEAIKKYEKDRELSDKSKQLQQGMKQLLIDPIGYLNEFFGAIEVDIIIPEEKYEYFGEMPPIFKNIEYSDELSGEFMKKTITKVRGKYQTSRKLIASLKGDRMVMNSDLLKWLVEKGAVITKVYGIIPAIRGRPFKWFMDWVSDERRKGDTDTKHAIIAEAAKLIGNSSYGRTGMNKNKFSKIRFCDEKQFNRAKNNYFYQDAEEYDGVYEVKSKPRTITQNMPIQVAFNVLQIAKLRMLQFAYDCIDKYVERKDFQFMYMDTDSSYMALSDDFDKLIKPELREEFEREKSTWFPRVDTPENKAFDKRTPGLFKEEWSGDSMIALCSKTYYCSGKEDKKSCKGLKKSTNIEILDAKTYKECLQNNDVAMGENKGIRYENHTMKTYAQKKIGLSPIYSKGVVMSDGCHIHPLNI